ncbi:uncharacterized protein EV154DRAFT_484179 [Mucor mucedo]|uniref:uncharacterized protein n=1 Tax=Mucor mucedo TaxID=29922 RepID=UPI00221F2F2A|nr:uncharacterized protein EV154DRAFT_484179 [Mucor mucedo]KAI7888317.1 hypothetical protein EV154DRAFT_484179 [Mucor mucedo]
MIRYGCFRNVDLLSLLYLLQLIIFRTCLTLVGAEYPVTIDDPDIKFSPRLFGRSTVMVNDTMYVYGGQSALSVGSSNDMYAHDFNVNTGVVNMLKVQQKNAGPMCAFCGAVMLNNTHMMILTNEFINATMDVPESDRVVRPYIFDFKTFTWFTNPTPPSYNTSLSIAFNLRTLHSTVLSADGMIYTMGGISYYQISTLSPYTWYYDPVKHGYDIVGDYNGLNYSSISPFTFNLP